MTCAAPLSYELLLDYWARDLPAAEADRVEEHVFGCEPCTARLAGIDAVATGIRRLTAEGRFRAAVPPSLADGLAASGLRIRTFRPRLGATIPCGAAPDDELLLSRIDVDLRGVARVDVSLCDERWAEQQRQVDVPFEPGRDEIVIAERVDAPHLRAPAVVRIRLLAVDAAGERELGTYALAHDPRGPPSP